MNTGKKRKDPKQKHSSWLETDESFLVKKIQFAIALTLTKYMNRTNQWLKNDVLGLDDRWGCMSMAS